MPIQIIVVSALAAGFAAFIVIRARRPRGGASPRRSEDLLLEDAIVTEPVAPGMEGRAEIRKEGAEPLLLRVRANDSAQAFARGSAVRVIDLREGCYVIEGADEEHLVR
jgi:hypothetical protein